MCGIVGFVGDQNMKVLRSMNENLVHRGPDEGGYFLDSGIGLAMRRLSIIDVSSGHQPIPNEDKTIWTVFNGEIYNFQELRRDLKKKGYRFRTDHSDTETIVHAYQEYGPEFVEHLNGMFAIAVWDVKKRRLCLYRDRLGEKPLYFWRYRNDFFFASEIKSLLAVPMFRRKLNPEALYFYLGLKNVPRHMSFFEGVESLAPGERLIFEKGKVRRERYWEIDASKTLRISEQDAVSEIRRILKSSVRYRMISDVPLGAYLSGGVDSSAVVGLMSRIRKKPIDTFSLTYKDTLQGKDGDERSAAEISERFATHHRKYRMDHHEFCEDLDEVINAFDEPFGGTISTYFLSKLIKKHVKVAVSGDGADEMFGSYKVHRLAYPMAHLNNFVDKGVDINNLSSSQLAKLAPFDQELDFLRSIQARHPYQWHSKTQVYSDEDKMALLSAKVKRKLSGVSMLQYYRKAYARCQSDDILNQVLQVECENLLPDHVLAFVDRLSMAHSVEVRPPFLDHRLVEFVFKLPGKMKIQKGVNKYILKKAVRGILPKRIIDRPKEGFILPYHFWMQKYLKKRIQSLLGAKSLKKHGLFNERYVRTMVDEYNAGSLQQSNKIYLLFMFQIWWNKYFD